MPLLSRESPCIGFCSTVYGDDVCRGCNRFFEEVVNWQSLALSQRDAAMERVHHILRVAVSEYLCVVDAELLALQLQKHQIPIPDLDSAEARVLALLYAGAQHMRDLDAYGLQATAAGRGRSAQDLRIAIVARRVELAQAQYQEWRAQPCQVRAFG